jgi:hypothetical protein
MLKVLKPPAEAATLIELDAEFENALAAIEEWKLAEASMRLIGLYGALPKLAGSTDIAMLRKWITACLPSDYVGIKQAAVLANYSQEAIRVWCRAGKIGRLERGKYLIGRRELGDFLVATGRRTKHFDA